MRSYSRILDRLRAVASLGLPPELAVPEMAIQIGRALGTATYPAVLVTERETAASPENFTAWLCADQTVRELRGLLQMGIWPGPRDTPSLQTIMSERTNRRIFAATLWGDGCIDEGPWGDLWRSRGIQQGLQAACFPPSGRVLVMVMARATGKKAFSAADIAFGEQAVPILETAIDVPVQIRDRYDEAVPTVQMILDGSPGGAMSFGAAETLRDMGGGGPHAVESMVAAIGHLAGKLVMPVPMAVAGDPFLPIRRQAANPAEVAGSGGSLRKIVMARNPFGAFSVTVSPLAGAGESKLVTVERKVPRALLAVRGALQAGASAREIQLVAALVRGETLEGASAALGVNLSSTRTLLERIQLRAGARTRPAALAHLVETGRAWSW